MHMRQVLKAHYFLFAYIEELRNKTNINIQKMNKACILNNNIYGVSGRN